MTLTININQPLSFSRLACELERLARSIEHCYGDEALAPEDGRLFNCYGREIGAWRLEVEQFVWPEHAVRSSF